MAGEQQEQSIPIWIRVVTGVLLFAITVGGVSWAASRGSTTHTFIVESLLKTDLRHDKEISKNAEGIVDVKSEQHRAELARKDTDNKLDFVINGMSDIEEKQDKFIEYLMQYDYDKKREAE
jgi:hypothetical protein